MLAKDAALLAVLAAVLATVAVLSIAVPNTLATAYNCEPLIASVDVAEILPAARLVILRSLPTAPTLTKLPAPAAVPAKVPNV